MRYYLVVLKGKELLPFAQLELPTDDIQNVADHLNSVCCSLALDQYVIDESHRIWTYSFEPIRNWSAFPHNFAEQISLFKTKNIPMWDKPYKAPRFHMVLVTDVVVLEVISPSRSAVANTKHYIKDYIGEITKDYIWIDVDTGLTYDKDMKPLGSSYSFDLYWNGVLFLDFFNHGTPDFISRNSGRYLVASKAEASTNENVYLIDNAVVTENDYNIFISRAKKVERKKMTRADIEKALGYPIVIIS